jgi:hypothetical protein
MFVVGYHCWDEEVWDECRSLPGWARPRLDGGTSIGGVAFLSMAVTGIGSIVKAASGRRTIGPELKKLPKW